jgi:hypothetical protein
LWPCRWSGRPPATLVQRLDALVRLRSVAEHYFRQHAEVGEFVKEHKIPRRWN